MVLFQVEGQYALAVQVVVARFVRHAFALQAQYDSINYVGALRSARTHLTNDESHVHSYPRVFRQVESSGTMTGELGLFRRLLPSMQ
jgi:hypothetical protein